MRDIFQHTLVPNAMLVVDGDQVSVFIAPVQDPRITGIELEVTIGEDLDTSQMANLPQATFQVSWQFNDAFNPTPVVVRARYVAENNTYSGWSNAYTRIQVLPHLGTSAGAWFASLILRLGFEAAVGFAFGGPAGALSSVAGYIVEQGLKDLGVNPVAAKILVGVFTVGSAGAAGVFGPNGVGEVRKIIPAVYQSELSKGIPKEMAWQRAMEVASHLQGTILKSAAAKAAIKESVDTLKGEIFKGGVEPE